jgi:hypothetical protein
VFFRFPHVLAQIDHNIDFVIYLCHAVDMPARSTRYRKTMKQVNSGELVKVANGIYAKPEELMDIEGDFYRATLICGKTSKL